MSYIRIRLFLLRASGLQNSLECALLSGICQEKPIKLPDHLFLIKIITVIIVFRNWRVTTHCLSESLLMVDFVSILQILSYMM